jgi:hypothetical protein
MLVSELIETAIPYREKKALRRLQDVIGDGPIEWFGQHVAGLREVGSIAPTTLATYKSDATKAINRALGVVPRHTRATKTQTETADELWRACLVALLPTHQVGEAVERADRAVAAWRRRVANR